jgi:coenzyme F420-reducing hydrogenase beta subunit
LSSPHDPDGYVIAAAERSDVCVARQLHVIGLDIEPEFVLAQLEVGHETSLKVLKQLIEAHIHIRRATFHRDVAVDPGEPQQGHDTKLPRVFHGSSGVPELRRRLELGGLVTAGCRVLREEGWRDGRGAGHQ